MRKQHLHRCIELLTSGAGELLHKVVARNIHIASSIGSNDLKKFCL